MKSAPAIAFDYRPSRWLAAAIVLIVLLALLALAFSGIDLWVKLGLACTACIYAAYALLRFLSVPLRRIAWHAAGHWRIVDARGAEYVVELRHAAVRGDWIVLIFRRTDGERVPLVLAPDNCDTDIRRRLRVRLRRAQEDAHAQA
jgi:toxin CptA